MLLLLLLQLLSPAALAGEGGDPPPASPFDKNHDGSINASDWKSMSDDEKLAYARHCVSDLGSNPDGIVSKDGQTRGEMFRRGLELVYAK